MCFAQAGTVCSLSGFAPLHPYVSSSCWRNEVESYKGGSSSEENPLLVSKVAQKRTLKGTSSLVRLSLSGFAYKRSYNPLDCHSCAKFNSSGLNSRYALKQTAAWRCFIKHCLFQSAYGLHLLLLWDKQLCSSIGLQGALCAPCTYLFWRNKWFLQKTKKHA